jgi:hypothetical protein
MPRSDLVLTEKNAVSESPQNPWLRCALLPLTPAKSWRDLTEF